MTGTRQTSEAGNARLVSWHDPLQTRDTAASMAGLDFWRAVAAGELPPPPVGELMRFQVAAVDHGSITFTCTPDASMYNPLGMVHGGLACTLADTAAGCALHTALPAGVGYTSIEIKVNYLAAIRLENGRLTATGTVVKQGSRVAFTEAVITDASGRTVATASSTLLVFGSPASSTTSADGPHL